MADLKLGTTIGGSTVWTQSSLPMVATTDRLFYKQYLIYSELNKPTPGDIGAYSKSETYSKQEVEDLGKLRILDSRNTALKPSEYPVKTLTTFLGLGADLPSTNQMYSGFSVRGWTGGAASWQVASLSQEGSSDNKLWFRTSQNSTAWNAWARIYTSVDKPTPADINAVSRGGDIMTGALTAPAINGPRTGEKLVVASGTVAAPTLALGSAIHKSVDINTESGVVNVVYNNTPQRVFHKGYCPTKVDVGLNNLMNWGYTDLPDVSNQNLYATAKAVDAARTLAFVYSLIL